MTDNKSGIAWFRVSYILYDTNDRYIYIYIGFLFYGRLLEFLTWVYTFFFISYCSYLIVLLSLIEMV